MVNHQECSEDKRVEKYIALEKRGKENRKRFIELEFRGGISPHTHLFFKSPLSKDRQDLDCHLAILPVHLHFKIFLDISTRLYHSREVPLLTFLFIFLECVELEEEICR